MKHSLDVRPVKTPESPAVPAVCVTRAADSAAVRGAVVAANELAARSGARVLESGGSAADAAVAVAAVLGVVDPANCGIGGYGGFAVVDGGDKQPVSQFAFNTAVPKAYRPGTARAGAGALVSPPAVVAGLCALHGRFGRLAACDVWAPAIEFARNGFEVGTDLAVALRWAAEKHRGLNAAFRRTFFRDGEPLRAGEVLRQPRLAQTLEYIAGSAGEAMKTGAVVESICGELEPVGGCLDAEDFRDLEARVGEAVRGAYEGAEIWAPDAEQSGAGVFLAALGALDGAALGEARSEQYVRTLGAALAHAWRLRDASYRQISVANNQTTHLCIADGEGLLVSMTFTHGPMWFGSGVMTEDTGIVLNAGARLFVRRVRDDRLLAQTNLAPIIVRHGSARYALGSPGGKRIPAVVLQAVVDLVHYAVPLDRALAGARVSADAQGALEAEGSLVNALPGLAMREIKTAEYFGPAGIVAVMPHGARGARDPRFDGACVHVA